MFKAEVRTKDGLEYEPEGLKSMLATLDRHLKEHVNNHSVTRDRQFYHSKLVLDGKVKYLRQQGKEKRPNGASGTLLGQEKLWATPVQELFLGLCGGKKLRAATVERQSIIQVTGHASDKSLHDYDEGSEREHQELSHNISGTPQTTTSNGSL